MQIGVDWHAKSSLNSIEKISQVEVVGISRDTSIYNEHSTYSTFLVGKIPRKFELSKPHNTEEESNRRDEKTELIEMEIWYLVDIFSPFILIYVYSLGEIREPILRSFFYWCVLLAAWLCVFAMQ